LDTGFQNVSARQRGCHDQRRSKEPKVSQVGITTVLRRPGIFLDGEMREASSTETIEVIDPTRVQVFGEVSDGSAADVDRAVRSGHAAQSGPWPRLTFAERADVLRRLAERIDEEREDLARLAAREMGWPIAGGRRLGEAVELIHAYIDAAERVKFEYLRRGGSADAIVVRRPIGVVGGIIPWNAPLRAAIKKTIPAMLVGCSVVLKPSSEAPFDSLRLGELAIEAGVPTGVLNVVPGRGPTGEALVAHPDVRKIAFTGSTAVGRRIAALGGEKLKRLQLELGGKSAAVILDDVDLESVAGSLSKQVFRASGQTCTALTRAIVPRRHQAEIVAALAEAAAAEVIGDPLDEATTMGPLASRRQLERVLGFLESARSEGAVAAVGGGRPGLGGPGFFVEPTVLVDVLPTMTVAQEEIFGPVLSVLAYDTEEQAVELANDSAYGLHGAVFSADPARALDIARRFDTGTVSINGLPIPITTPFGGVKASGLGREHGVEGYDHFLEYQSLVVPDDLAADLAASVTVS
jgi:aldehyde dehydrogenase (NAD+)